MWTTKLETVSDQKLQKLSAVLFTKNSKVSERRLLSRVWPSISLDNFPIHFETVSIVKGFSRGSIFSSS